MARTTALLLLLLVTSSGAARSDALADACSRDNGQIILACPKSCAQPCGDAGFAARTSGILAACRGVISRPQSQRVDKPDCARLVGLPADTAAASAEEDYATAKNRCDSAFLKPEGGVIKVPEADEEPDSCFVSFRNLECRLGALRSNLTRFEGLLKDIRAKKYGDSLIGAQLCSVGREQLEHDYSQADQAKQPIENLQRFFKEELGCFDKYISWTQKLTCIRDDKRCLERKDAEKKYLEEASEPSRRASAELRTTLDSAEKTVEDITNVWRLYRRRCL